ncbi:MAG: discoidin domain-containing protein [Candidatus Rokuibacteriota bacterium]
MEADGAALPAFPPRIRAIARADTLAAIGLLLLALISRVCLLLLPEFAEANYEEATVGVMARHILQGDYVVFWWGQPYLGTAQAYLAAALFGFLPATTLTLRLVPLLLSLTAAFFSYRLARDLVGPRWSLLTLLWWTVPPAFLTRFGLTPYNYITCVAYGSIILYLTHRAVYRSTGSPRVWYVLGGVWGLALWDHLISLAYVAASGLWLAFRALHPRGPTPHRGWLRRCAVGALVGSVPLWSWNLLHRFETITSMVTPHAASPERWLVRVEHVLVHLPLQLLGKAHVFWADPSGTMHSAALLGLVYLPVLAVSGYWLVRAVLPGRRRAASSFGDMPVGVELLVATVLFASAQVVFSQYNKGLYLMPIYSAVPVLLAAWGRWLSRRGRWLPGLLVIALLVLDGTDNFKLIEASVRRRDAPRPVDALIKRLGEERIRHVYAHYRVAWMLAFESGEAIIASDFHGYLENRFMLAGKSGSYMAPYFRDMVRVDLSPRVALVTHEGLGRPTAAQLADSLTVLGGSYRRTAVGQYTILHDFHPPSRAIREIPASSIRLRSSHRPEDAPRAIDRNIATRWQSGIPQQPGISLEADLDRPRRVAKIVLDPGSTTHDYPRAIRVEVSLDGVTWQEASIIPRHLGGADWLGGHPKFNVRGKLGIWIGPVLAKSIRLTQTAARRDGHFWTVAELFLYEDAVSPPDLSTLMREGALASIATFIRQHGIGAVYGSDEVSPLLIRELPPSVKTVTLRDKMFTPVERSERVVRFQRKTAFLLASESPRLAETLRRHGIPFQTHDVAGAVLYVAERQRDAPPLYWTENHLLALDPGR